MYSNHPKRKSQLRPITKLPVNDKSIAFIVYALPRPLGCRLKVAVRSLIHQRKQASIRQQFLLRGCSSSSLSLHLISKSLAKTRNLVGGQKSVALKLLCACEIIYCQGRPFYPYVAPGNALVTKSSTPAKIWWRILAANVCPVLRLFHYLDSQYNLRKQTLLLSAQSWRPLSALGGAEVIKHSPKIAPRWYSLRRPLAFDARLNNDYPRKTRLGSHVKSREKNV